MREILFKAKTIDSKIWVEGDLVQRTDSDGSNHYFIENNDFHDYRSYEVIPETVGQFTGLLDKNGNKIFEGDVVKWGHVCSYWFEDPFIVAIVEFSPELSFNAVNIGSKYGFSNFIYQRTDKYLEKIGNIHDTPELL